MALDISVHVGDGIDRGVIDDIAAEIIDLDGGGDDPCQVLRLRMTTRFSPDYGGPNVPLTVGRVEFFHADRLFAVLDAAREAYAHRHEEANDGGPVTLTAEEAEEMGFTVDRCTYPWFAYKGPRFEPTDTIPIVTPADEG